jgi:hypothetical protein
MDHTGDSPFPQRRFNLTLHVKFTTADEGLNGRVGDSWTTQVIRPFLNREGSV